MPRTATFTLGLAIALAGPLAADTADSIRAVGNEPSWTVNVSGDRLDLRRLGFEDLSLPVTGQTDDGGSSVIETHDPDLALRAVLVLDPGLCHDTMTGMPYPLNASLSMGDQTMIGCAGDPLDLLTGQEWQVEDIGGAGIVDSSMVTLAFDADGRLSGSTGCNRMTGGYELTGEGLTIGPMATTMMACPDALMAQEMSVSEALGRVTRFDIDETGALILLGGDSPVIVARAIE